MRGWDYFADAPDTLRGLARAATIVDSVRRASPGRVVLVDAGDLLQGSPLTYVAARVDYAAPHPVIAAMNAMHYDAAAVGNHEFNYGLPTLTRAVGRGDLSPPRRQRLPPRRLARLPRVAHRRTRDGIRIAIVGATNPGAMVWDRDNLTGRLEIRDIVTEVAREVRRCATRPTPWSS